MIDKSNEIKQGVITAILSAAVLTGSLYAYKALDYRDRFIPGTVINGIRTAEHSVLEIEEFVSG